MSSRSVCRACAQVAPSGEYLRGLGRVAVDLTALRRLWQHLPVLGLVILACVPVYAVVVAVCQLLNKDYYYYYYYFSVSVLTDCRAKTGFVNFCSPSQERLITTTLSNFKATA